MLLVGIDLIETNRIRKCMKNPRFCSKILGSTEYSQLEMRGFPVQSVAASFCAKEAFSKAVGTGLSRFALSDVELLRDSSGKPFLKLSGRALTLASLHHAEFSVSVTHTKEYAATVVIGQEEAASEGIKL